MPDSLAILESVAKDARFYSSRKDISIIDKARAKVDIQRVLIGRMPLTDEEFAELEEFIRCNLESQAQTEERDNLTAASEAAVGADSDDMSTHDNAMSASKAVSGNTGDTAESNTASAINHNVTAEHSLPHHPENIQDVEEAADISRVSPTFSKEESTAEKLPASKEVPRSDHDQIRYKNQFSMTKPIFNRPSQSLRPASQHSAREGDALNMSNGGKQKSEKRVASDDQIAYDDQLNVPLTAEDRAKSFMRQRLSHWKDVLEEQKHSLPGDESKEVRLPVPLDFNASMLSREDYEELLEDPSGCHSTHTTSSPAVSPSEQSTATTALLYGLSVFKDASSAQQHDMVTSLMHPKVRILQPSLAFEMTALLLEIDTLKLLSMTVDDEALFARAKKVARAWGVELSNLESGPDGVAW
ncbi:unnamed protein product [Aureobasidium vineae]|uniref:PABC domain-containing protein n=1 Tax=Aureobasidium vineae TaxID=2773715 RepID=A0A9N8JNT2_9PEZI|nr:unnamed protein product [Aureobasidium vineae]